MVSALPQYILNVLQLVPLILSDNITNWDTCTIVQYAIHHVGLSGFTVCVFCSSTFTHVKHAMTKYV